MALLHVAIRALRDVNENILIFELWSKLWFKPPLNYTETWSVKTWSEPRFWCGLACVFEKWTMPGLDEPGFEK